MEKEKRELRMYFLVMGNISPIQQGIQAGHCALEYANIFGNTKLYEEWFSFKTFILLSGGTSNSGVVLDERAREWWIDETKLGSMEKYEKYLIDNKIPYASFNEPDLNDALSVLCFICDEKVFDFVNYPPFEKLMEMDISELDSSSDIFKYLINLGPLDTEDEMEKSYEKFVGGEQNVRLKELIYGKKLA